MPNTNTAIDRDISNRGRIGIVGSVHHTAVGNSNTNNVTLNSRLRSPNIVIETKLMAETMTVRRIADMVGPTAEIELQSTPLGPNVSNIAPIVQDEILSTIHELSNFRIWSTASGIWCSEKLNMP